MLVQFSNCFKKKNTNNPKKTTHPNKTQTNKQTKPEAPKSHTCKGVLATEVPGTKMIYAPTQGKVGQTYTTGRVQWQ